jgi:hypothetical protein
MKILKNKYASLLIKVLLKRALGPKILMGILPSIQRKSKNNLTSKVEENTQAKLLVTHFEFNIIQM